MIFRTMTRAVLILVGAALLVPSLGHGQAWTPPAHEPSLARAEVETLGWNMLIGGVTAGLMRGFRGEPVWRGVLEGAAGGAMMFGGKRLAVEHFAGAGLLGRQTSAVGASMVRNSSASRPLLSELVLPLGPFRVYVAPRRAGPISARIDLAGAAATLHAVLDGDTRFDASASLSSGAPVFHDEAEETTSPYHVAGVIWLAGQSSDHSYGMAHERVHVLQYDAGFIAAALPAERAMFARSAGAARVGRYVDLGINVPVWATLNQIIAYETRPWEREAHFLTLLTRGEPPPAEPGGQLFDRQP